jgi:hypothetical protein
MPIFFCDYSKYKSCRSAKRMTDPKVQGKGQWGCNQQWYKCKFLTTEEHKDLASYTIIEYGGVYLGSNNIAASSEDEDDITVGATTRRATPVATGL